LEAKRVLHDVSILENAEQLGPLRGTALRAKAGVLLREAAPEIARVACSLQEDCRRRPDERSSLASSLGSGLAPAERRFADR
jgi:hypothetical protein